MRYFTKRMNDRRVRLGAVNGAESVTVESDAVGAGQLVHAVDSYAEALAHQRGRLRTAWQTANEPVARRQSQLRATDATIARRKAQLKKLEDRWARHRIKADPDFAIRYNEGLRDTVGDYVERGANGEWTIKPIVEQVFDRAIEIALEGLQQEYPPGRSKRDARQEMERFLAWIWRLEALRKVLEEDLTEVTPVRDEQMAPERAQADRVLETARVLAVEAAGRLPAHLQPWDSPAWADWAVHPTESALDDLYAGTLTPLDDADLGDNASFGSEARFPFFLSLRRNLELVYDAASRDHVLSLARSLLLRQLAAVNPGDSRFCFFDPVGLGQSAADFLGLAEYNADLIGGKAWSAQADLAARLAELTAHIEQVIQKYLRTTYETIDEFNAAAGEIAEPYRYLVLFDFPTGFTEETVHRLRSIMQNGPRCGVRTLLLTNKAVKPAYGVDPGQLAGAAQQFTPGGNFVREDHGYTLTMRIELEPDSAARDAAATSIIDSVGRRAATRAEGAVSFEKAFTLFTRAARRGPNPGLSTDAATTDAGDEATWWRDDSTRGLFAPIGQKGARDAAILSFDSRDQSGALLVGRPGSGKSTLLHTLIGGLTTLYSPRELELYLIDFKEGVEFKAYAEEGLPHARMVAIESDREFGLSVLQSLEAEMSRRGGLLRGTGGQFAGLQALREATGEPVPRVLLVFDEFQVLFARNDKLGIAAAGLLETIIRQGRGFGVHVLLGSQSLAGLDALGSHVPQLLPTRILLPAAEADARRVLGDGNDAGQYLTVHGEGVLNTAGGAVEANERFKGALLAEPDRIERLRRLRAKADAAGFTRRPAVFEGNASVPLDATAPAAFRAELARSGAAPVLLRAGVPMAVSASVDIDLRRESGGNVLAVVRDGDEPGGPAQGLLTACVASAAQSPARIDIIDFMPPDDGLDEVFEPLLDRGRCTLRRRRAFAPLLGELRKEVRERVGDDDTRRPARLAFLFGIHRARELDADIGSLDADPDLAEALEEIMRDGPEVGVHVWLWSDSVSGAARRLSPRMMRECAWRIAGKMSADDSLSLLGNERAADIRDRQLMLANDDRGILTRAMSFGLPGASWLTSVLGESPDPAAE
jgi:S-DNA-T family DNA segregation ATPase FtsK/SpoIIIE